jgi:DNA polymerase-3 subunit beta
MKINVMTKEIQTAIKNLLKVTPSKSKLEMLNGIKIIATESVRLIAVNHEVMPTIIELKEAEVIESGSIVLTKETLKLIQKLNDTYMTIASDKIESGKRNIKYIGLDPVNYPDIPSTEFTQPAFTISKEKMLEVISITYACAVSESTPVLQGLLFKGKAVTACDRHRLALATIESNENTNDMVIASTSLNLISSFIDKQYKGGFTFTVDSHNRHVRIVFDNVTMLLRLIEGTYPDTTKIIPQHFKSEVKINKKELVEELQLMKEIADKTGTINIDVKNDKLYIKVGSKDSKNTLTSELDVKKIGEDLSICFNLELLLDGLKNNKNEYIVFKMTGEYTPAMIDYNYLVLPYRNAKKAA